AGGGPGRGSLRAAVDDGAVRRRERSEPESVDQVRAGERMEVGEDGAQAPEARAVKARRVDLSRGDDAERDPTRRRDDGVVEPLALGGLDLLGVVQEGKRPDPMSAQRLVVEEHHGEREWGGERAPTTL